MLPAGDKIHVMDVNPLTMH